MIFCLLLLSALFPWYFSVQLLERKKNLVGPGLLLWQFMRNWCWTGDLCLEVRLWSNQLGGLGGFHMTLCTLPKAFFSPGVIGMPVSLRREPWLLCWRYNILKVLFWDFPGGAVLESLPATAGDTGSSPGPGRSHVPWSNYARVPRLLSLHTTTTEVADLDPMLRNKRSHRNEKPAHCNEEQPLLAATRESPRTATKTKCSQK